MAVGQTLLSACRFQRQLNFVGVERRGRQECLPHCFSVNIKDMMHRNAFTIIESMLATVVLATAVLGISSALGVSHQQNQTLRERGILLQLAGSLAEEVASTPFTNSTGGFGNGWAANNKNRRTYDDVYDFDGYADQSPFDSMIATGQQMDYQGNYRRSVKVEALATPAAAAASQVASNFARVTISALAPSGRKVSIQRWVARVDVER